jgi:hypothetical protein
VQTTNFDPLKKLAVQLPLAIQDLQPLSLFSHIGLLPWLVAILCALKVVFQKAILYPRGNYCYMFWVYYYLEELAFKITAQWFFVAMMQL